MSEDKPLHVRVAEALGCKVEHTQKNHCGFEWQCGCEDRLHGWEQTEGYCPHMKRYEYDWSATGPLIEEYGITIETALEGKWSAAVYTKGGIESAGTEWTFYDTPLLAVCHLILALKEAGKI